MKNFIPTIIFILTIGCASHYNKTKKREYKKFTDTAFNVGDIIKPPRISFLIGHCDIMAFSNDSIKVIADFIKKHPSFKVEIGVHSDNRGNTEANLKLSECRAMSIFDYLTKELRIPFNNFVTKGYGGTDLLISDETIKKLKNETEEEKEHVDSIHAKNRRVEIKILKTK